MRTEEGKDLDPSPAPAEPREWVLGWEQWVGVRAEEGPVLGRQETVRVREVLPEKTQERPCQG